MLGMLDIDVPSPRNVSRYDKTYHDMRQSLIAPPPSQTSLGVSSLQPHLYHVMRFTHRPNMPDFMHTSTNNQPSRLGHLRTAVRGLGGFRFTISSKKRRVMKRGWGRRWVKPLLKPTTGCLGDSKSAAHFACSAWIGAKLSAEQPTYST